jgi:hypothetical protein
MTQHSSDPGHAIDRLSATASRVTSIDAISQVFGQFSVDRKRANQPMDVTISRGKPAVSVVDGRIRVTLSYGFLATPDNSESDPKSDIELPAIVDIRAVFDIDYTFSNGETLSDEDMQIFAEINGNLNATAYWREYINSCLSRSHLPPFVLPPFNAAKHIMRLKKESVLQENPVEESDSRE